MSDTIRNYTGPDRIRRRPQVIFFRAKYEGAIVLLLNLIDWSVQEHLLGEATHVQVTKFKDGSFTISDDGAGLPIEGNDDFAGGWQEIFCGVYPQKEGEYIFSVDSERQHKLREKVGDDRFYANQLTLFSACASCEFLVFKPIVIVLSTISSSTKASSKETYPKRLITLTAEQSSALSRIQRSLAMP